MENSPGNRVIETLTGMPQEIIDRGTTIETLGQSMLNSANVLESIATRALEIGGQQGKAIDALRESIGDSYTVLKQAGELYEPVGPVLVTYGEALEDVQPKLNSSVTDCQSLWEYYASLPGDKDGNTEPEAGGGFLGIGEYEADSPEAQQVADENQAAKDAYEAWEARAGDFDTYYETWDEAFEAAVSGVDDTVANSIEDQSWWDSWGSDLFEVLNTVLSIAGLIVGIVALFTGGWILVLIVGIAALVVTAVRYAHDEASGFDLALAIVGVIPFGKFTSMAAPLRGATDAADFAGTATRSGPLANALTMATSGQKADDLARMMRAMEDLGIGRQLLTSQLFVGSKVTHLGSVYQGVGTVSQLGDLPEQYDKAVNLINRARGIEPDTDNGPDGGDD